VKGGCGVLLWETAGSRVRCRVEGLGGTIQLPARQTGTGQVSSDGAGEALQRAQHGAGLADDRKDTSTRVLDSRGCGSLGGQRSWSAGRGVAGGLQAGGAAIGRAVLDARRDDSAVAQQNVRSHGRVVQGTRPQPFVRRLMCEIERGEREAETSRAGVARSYLFRQSPALALRSAPAPQVPTTCKPGLGSLLSPVQRAHGSQTVETSALRGPAVASVGPHRPLRPKSLCEPAAKPRA
jgi:hypothetical protein